MSDALIQGYEYRRWQRDAGHRPWIWPAILRNEIKLAIREAKTRMLVLTSAILVLGAAGMFYLISVLEALMGLEEAQEPLAFIKMMLGVDLSGLNVAQFRDALWRITFLLIIKIQMVWVLIIVARVGAGLISKDLRTRALPIYFSKPVTPLTYLLGKWTVIAAFITLITLLPNLVALILGLAITGGPGSLAQVLSMAGGLLSSGLLLCVVAGAVILALSSLSSDQRYVTVGWVAICLLSIFAQRIVTDALPVESSNTWLRAISLQDNFVIISERLLGVRAALETAGLPSERLTAAILRPMEPSHVIVLATLTICCLAVAWTRVIKFSRSAASIR